MNSLKAFVRRSLIGGVLVVLPIVILGFVFRWAFRFVTDLIQPLTDYVIDHFNFAEIVADFIVIGVLIAFCFVVGTIISTGIGRWLHQRFDLYFDKIAPGYRIIKEVVSQFFGDKENSPFGRGEVVRVQLFGKSCPTTVTAIVTDYLDDGQVTIFMPTGPNPTSGNIYHVPRDLVEFIKDAKVEEMMKSIIACGSGSSKLFRLKDK